MNKKKGKQLYSHLFSCFYTENEQMFSFFSVSILKKKWIDQQQKKKKKKSAYLKCIWYKEPEPELELEPEPEPELEPEPESELRRGGAGRSEYGILKGILIGDGNEDPAPFRVWDGDGK